MQAKKSYGQHFLKSTSISDAIAVALKTSCERYRVDAAIEVGPGKGILTIELLKHFEKLAVVEADRDMIAHLQLQKIAIRKEHLIEADFLKFDLNSIFPNEQIAIVGNFPYNISSQILFKVIENRVRVPVMVGMFQREVAQRVAAVPGSKTYGIISVLTQAYFHVEYLFEVGPEQFNPPPKVQSAVIKLESKGVEKLPCDEKLFKSVVKTSFNQRRKMLRNSLKSFDIDQIEALEPFMEMRPEMLNFENFITIAQHIEHLIRKRG